MVKKKSEHAEDLVINSWPSTTDCVDWSEDGQIAIAAGDDVHLLIPRVNTMTDDFQALWESIRLRVTSFSPDEIQPQHPISAASFSIGEEISAADVVAAKWTPQGIAENQRCTLLIHTQNLILSIWTSSPQPRLERAWQRRAIINDHIKHFFLSQRPGLCPRVGEMSEELRTKIRVRAFTMSEVAYTRRTAPSGCLDPYILIATSNDANEVIITRCQGSGNATPDLETIHSFSFAKPAMAPSLEWTFETYMENPRFIQHLAWSPWIILPSGSRMSLVACGSYKQVRFQRIEVKHGKHGLELSSSEFRSPVDLKQALSSDVLLKWLRLSEGRYVELLLCTIAKVVVLTIDTSGEEEITTKVRERDDWGQIAGLHFQPGEGRRLQILPHSIKRDGCVITLDLHELDLCEETSDYLSNALKYHMASLDPRYKHINNEITTRIWGFTSSYLGDLTATVVTFHPSYAPEYVIPADMSAIVLFQHVKQNANLVSRALQGQISAEALTLSIKWLFKGIEQEGQRSILGWEMYNEIEATMKTMSSPELDLATASFHDLLFSTGGLMKTRLERLISIVVHWEATDEIIEKLVAELLVKLICGIPQSRYMQTKMTKIMLSIMHQILVSLNLEEANDDNAVEICATCNGEIFFQDFKSAQCLRGHQFRRCGLSFLSIQEPGVSKTCGICGKQYLQSRYIEDQATDVELEISELHEARGVARPLTQALADACRQCVYCGGKLIG